MFLEGKGSVRKQNRVVEKLVLGRFRYSTSGHVGVRFGLTGDKAFFADIRPRAAAEDCGSYAPNLFQSSFLVRRAPNSRAPSRTKTQPTTAAIVQVPAHLRSSTKTKAAAAKPNTAIQDKK